MTRKIAVLVAAIAALAITCQSADAKGRKGDKTALLATSIVVGAGSTLAFLSLNDWTFKDGNGTNGFSTWGAWTATTLACAAVSPMVGTAVLKRPLKYREAHILVGSCVVPIVGGYLVNQAYKAGWITAPDERHAKRRGKKKG